jgi:hypothetical protein
VQWPATLYGRKQCFMAGSNALRLRRSKVSGPLLDYPPENELGGIFLFAQLARRRFGFKVERIQPHFPDCLGRRAGKRIRIEYSNTVRGDFRLASQNGLFRPTSYGARATKIAARYEVK